MKQTLSHLYGCDDLHVRPSIIHGNGLFTNRNFQKNEILTFYDGEHIDWKEAHSREPSYIRGLAFGFAAIDGLRTPVIGRGLGSFCNHSSTPNAIFWVRDDVVWIKARQVISSGEEVVVNYGRVYWERSRFG